MTEENGSIPLPLTLSLDLELGTLASATRGAQILADLQARRGLQDAELERAAPACIMSMLALVTERLGQLRRVVRNEENPAHLWAPHNAVEDPATSGEFPGDIVLFSRNSLRLPLVMWGNRGVEAQEEAKGRVGRGRKAKSRKPRDVALGSSEVSQGEPSTDPQPSCSEVHD